ncbi:MAG: GNAT family N-acetyltransferase [Granulosicoccaceae bacterium]
MSVDVINDLGHETERLVLRRWKDSDRKPFAQMNANPKVMEYFSRLRTLEESENMIELCNSRIEEHGFSFWAVERKDSNQFIGFVGLSRYTADLPFCPCVEIGWRLSHQHWGHGFATEAAIKCLEVGFKQLALPEIVSFTPLLNQRSRNVMLKIGMTDCEKNFLHPSETAKSGLQVHCMYKINKKQWAEHSRSLRPSL